MCLYADVMETSPGPVCDLFIILIPFNSLHYEFYPLIKHLWNLEKAEKLIKQVRATF